MPASHAVATSLDDFDAAERRELAKVIGALFERWQLDAETQTNLLGLSPSSRKLLPRYRRGEAALPGGRDVRDRVGYLLGIHKGLRLLFPHNEVLRFHWVHRRNTVLDGRTPLEVMTGEGLIGIARVARLVDFQRGQ